MKSIIGKVTERLLLFMGLLIGLVMCAVPAAAQTTDNPFLSQMEKDGLWVSNYRDIGVVIDVADDDKLGITKDDVRTKVELHLRQAGIRPAPAAKEGVWVQVTTRGTALHLRVELYRAVSWFLPNGRLANYTLGTWSIDRLGTHGYNRAFAMSGIDDMMDTFLNAYLKANQ